MLSAKRKYDRDVIIGSVWDYMILRATKYTSFYEI